MNEHDQALRQRIIDHCAWIATFDRPYAIDSYRRYRELLPWIEL